MIILYSKKINNNFLDILNKYENMEYNPDFRCPHCKSQNLIKWGSYNRYLCYCENNKIKEKTIKIKRMRCKDCGKTHALIPSFIVPYKIFTLDIVLSTLSNDNISISISYDTVSKWDRQFNKHLPYLKTMFKNLSKIEIIKKIKEDILNKYKQYFDINKKILMMVRAGIFDMAPF